MNVNGLVAVVTGGGSGLGAATASHLAKLGARVALLDSNETNAKALAESIKGLAYKVDVTDAEAVGKAFDDIASQWDTPRIVVNCAGIGHAARIVGRDGSLSIDLFEKTIRINLIGTYNVMSHAARLMVPSDPLDSNERGVIINTSSVAWQDGQVGQSAYAASKGGIASMSLPVARELAQFGVRVVAIAPGLFETPMMAGLPKEVTDAIASNIPFPARLGQPNEYALMVEQIVNNTYLNGTTIRLDGAVRLTAR